MRNLNRGGAGAFGFNRKLTKHRLAIYKHRQHSTANGDCSHCEPPRNIEFLQSSKNGVLSTILSLTTQARQLKPAPLNRITSIIRSTAIAG